MKRGFFWNLFKNASFQDAIQNGERGDGKIDPYAVAGAAHGLKGDLSDSDMAGLGAMLGAMGAFDDDEDE